MITRDSAKWYVAAGIAVCGYLLASPPPTQWTYYQWLQAGAALLMWLSGKLASSPLPHSEESQKGTGQ